VTLRGLWTPKSTGLTSGALQRSGWPLTCASRWRTRWAVVVLVCAPVGDDWVWMYEQPCPLLRWLNPGVCVCRVCVCVCVCVCVGVVLSQLSF